MRILRCLIAIALAYGLTGVAKADDFQMVVIDPTYSVNVITNTAFTFSLSPCEAPGQVPVGSDYQGCFTGQNETGQVLTSLQLEIPLIVGQTAGCALNGGGLDLFSDVTCSTGPNGYLLDFSDGDIIGGELFTVAEAGVDPSDFPDISASFNTPEPSSIWLLFTGVLSIGLFLARRQGAVRASRF